MYWFGEYWVEVVSVGCNSRKQGQLIEGKDAERYAIVGTYMGVVVANHDFGAVTLLLHMRSGNLQAYLGQW